MAGLVLNSTAVLRFNFCTKLNICASISATSPSCKPLVAMANQHLPKLKFDMKYPVLLIFFFIVHISYGQDKDLLQYKKYFDKDFKTWTATFSSFNLSKFKTKDT